MMYLSMLSTSAIISLSLVLSLSVSLCLPCVHDMATVSHLLLLLPSGDLCVFYPAPPPPSSPSPPSLSPSARDTQHQ